MDAIRGTRPLAGRTLSLSVSDTGKGISEADIARILQPFVQLADRNHRDGTGLGLPICQRLAALKGISRPASSSWTTPQSTAQCSRPCWRKAAWPTS